MSIHNFSINGVGDTIRLGKGGPTINNGGGFIELVPSSTNTVKVTNGVDFITTGANITGSNGLNITASTGNLQLNSISWPSADGSANQVLTTDGSGSLSFINIDTLETSTLDDVTGRGNTTTNTITVGGLTSNGDTTIGVAGTDDHTINGHVGFINSTTQSELNGSNWSSPSSLTINIDSDNNSTNANFRLAKDAGTQIFNVSESGNITTHGNIVPSADSTNSLGSATNFFTNVYTDDVSISTLGAQNEIVIVGSNDTLTSSDLLTIDTVNDRVGVGTTSPARTLHMVGEQQHEASIRVDQYHDSADGPDILLQKARGTVASPAANQSLDELGRIIGYSHDGTSFGISAELKFVADVDGSNYGSNIEFHTGTDTGASSSRMLIEPTGQIAIAETSDPSSRTGFAHIYAKDTSGTSEMFVRDEAGNVTQISPHNDEGDWVYWSENTKTGKKVKVNMEKMIRKLEEITGETFFEEYIEGRNG